MVEGDYSPRHLRRYYFSDETVDQVHLSDRVFQHGLLKQLKPTFKYVMSKNCYHLHGPTGVKTACEQQTHELLRIVPHPRTLRKARENIKAMVNDGVSLQKIKTYFRHFVIWVNTSELWTYEELLGWFIRACWNVACGNCRRLTSTPRN